MAVCLATALTSAVLVTNAFTLAWTHSIEKIRWEEDWVVRDGTLVLESARVLGHGAGMEPPPGAVLTPAGWQWYPRSEHECLHLARSGFVPDYIWCEPSATCRAMGEILPSDGKVTELWACNEPGLLAKPAPAR